jgi:hypothetical protein
VPRVGFEPTITVFERMKTVRALDRATTVIGISLIYRATFLPIIYFSCEVLVIYVGEVREEITIPNESAIEYQTFILL